MGCVSVTVVKCNIITNEPTLSKGTACCETCCCKAVCLADLNKQKISYSSPV